MSKLHAFRRSGYVSIVLALKETSDLWGGKLKHLETTLRKAYETHRTTLTHCRNLCTRPPKMVQVSRTH